MGVRHGSLTAVAHGPLLTGPDPPAPHKDKRDGMTSTIGPVTGLRLANLEHRLIHCDKTLHKTARTTPLDTSPPRSLSSGLRPEIRISSECRW